MLEVKMNSMDGVVLMTAGKKVEENIRVVPTFETLPETCTVVIDPQNMYTAEGGSYVFAQTVCDGKVVSYDEPGLDVTMGATLQIVKGSLMAISYYAEGDKKIKPYDSQGNEAELNINGFYSAIENVDSYQRRNLYFINQDLTFKID